MSDFVYVLWIMFIPFAAGFLFTLGALMACWALDVWVVAAMSKKIPKKASACDE
jgi:hypothetical protein